MDKEFAEAFKEDLELNEMKWEVGVVYHQEFKNGDKVYFRADSVQKNKRWKGLSVDEFGGRQKKAKSASADEKQQGWETTPKNEIPKGLKEEVEIDEGKFKKGDIVIPNMGPHKGDKHKIIHDFGDGSYNITPQKHSRFIKYKQGAAKAKENQLKLVKEEVEVEEEKAPVVFAVRHTAKDGKRFRSKNPRYGVTKCPKCKSTDLDLAYGEEVEVDEARSKEDELELAKTIAAWKKAGGKVKKLPPGKKFKSLFKGKALPRQEEVEIDEEKYIVTAKVRGRRENISKPLDKKQAEKSAVSLKHDMEIAIPKYQFASDIKVEKIKEEVELDEAAPMYPPTIKNLRMIVKDKQNQVFMFKVGKARVDLFTASAIIAVYDGLKKPEHKKKLEDMIKTKEGFLKTQAFAMKMVK